MSARKRESEAEAKLASIVQSSMRHAPDVVIMVISPEHLSRLVLPRSSVPGGTPVLTRRENEVLRVMADGLSNQAIAERLSLSVNTIRNHVQLILDKLDAHSKLEAVVMATRWSLGCVPAPPPPLPARRTPSMRPQTAPRTPTDSDAATAPTC